MNGFTNCPNSQDGSARRLSGFIPYLRLYYEHFGDNNNNLNNLIRVKYSPFITSLKCILARIILTIAF